MKITVPVDGGEEVEFECADNWASRWVSEAILGGQTYPYLPFVDDVQVIVDAGANCGATTVHFARHYPEAEVHALEPARGSFEILERNVAAWPRVHAHRVGLHEVDQEVPLYGGDGDAGMASVIPRSINLGTTEIVQLRAAGAWAREQGIDRIDILKVDVEGCEIEVLESLSALLPTVKVCYLEYDSRQARRDIARLLDPTHEMFRGAMFLDQGECIYLRADLAALDDATDALRELYARGLSANAEHA